MLISTTLRSGAARVPVAKGLNILSIYCLGKFPWAYSKKAAPPEHTMKPAGFRTPLDESHAREVHDRNRLPCS